MRGVINEGNTCHISCALQLIYHCLPDLVSSFLHDTSYIEENDDRKDARQALAAVLVKLGLGGNFESQSLDAGRFYSSLEAWSCGRVTVDNQGDAITTLFLILKLMNVEDRAEECGLLGEYEHFMTTYSNGKIIKERSKERGFQLRPFPLSIRARDGNIFRELPEILHHNFIDPLPILGKGSEIIEQTFRFTNIPDSLLIHLKRFDFDIDERKILKIVDAIDIPLVLDMSLYTSEAGEICDLTYALQGILLHDGSESTGGHYVVCVKVDDCWILQDDEDVNCVSNSNLELLIGSKVDIDDEPRSVIALLYSSLKKETEAKIINHADRYSVADVVTSHNLLHESELVTALLQSFQIKSDSIEKCSNDAASFTFRVLFQHILNNSEWDNVFLATSIVNLSLSSEFVLEVLCDLQQRDLLLSGLNNLAGDLSSRISIEKMFVHLSSKENFQALAVIEILLSNSSSKVDSEVYDVIFCLIRAIQKGLKKNDRLQIVEYIFKALNRPDILPVFDSSSGIYDIMRYCLFDINLSVCKDPILLITKIRSTLSQSGVQKWKKFISEIELEYGSILITREFCIICEQELAWKVYLSLLDIDDCFQERRLSYLVDTDFINQWLDVSINEKSFGMNFLLRLLKRSPVVLYLLENGYRGWLITSIRNHCGKDFPEVSVLKDYLRQLMVVHREELSHEWGSVLTGYDSDDNPISVINRKIKIRWSKGQWYEGRIKAFRASDGKHEIVYDDGKDYQFRLFNVSHDFLI